jgi:two-component system chemotaxis sensor kinase CheA
MDGFVVMMNDSQANILAGFSTLVDKLALELVFAQPASDAGLLPINSFIIEMEEASQANPLPQTIFAAISKAREVIDNTFATTGQFTSDALDLLNAWVPWFQSVLSALSAGKTPPEFQFASSATSARITPSCAAPNPCDSAFNSDSNPLRIDLEADREVLTEFVNESREHLQNIESGALILEEDPGDTATLNSIFRAFHTFKGGSGFLNLTVISELAHELESLLDLARQGRLQITSDIIEVILNGGDTLKQFIEAIEMQLVGEAPESPIVIPTAPLSERIALAAASARHLDAASETAFIRRAATTPETPKAKSPSTNTTVKVDTQKLDALIDMVGEMVIAQSLVAQEADLKALANPRLARSLAQLARTTSDLQRTALSLRMVPVGPTFRKMNRVIRDLSMRSGKQIELVVRGAETELDRNIVEAIHDPILHMIRNSIDHGIEKPAARESAGKPPTGQITLAAFHQGGNVIIQIQDDGAGLNREKILKKASALGLFDPNIDLGEKEVFNLIFAPGFSTAETITDISGRGVGMDVVRRNIEQLRGKIEIQSRAGQGTTFSIYLPLTLAIIDGLIVRIGAERFILPTLSVRESFRPTPKMLFTVHGKGEIVDVRGKLLPLIRLNEFLAIDADQTDPTQAVLIVIEADGSQRCVLVDELIGKQEVVIKSIGDTLHHNPLFAGAAILADGRVGLILEAAALAHPKQTPLSKAA